MTNINTFNNRLYSFSPSGTTAMPVTTEGGEVSKTKASYTMISSTTSSQGSCTVSETTTSATIGSTSTITTSGLGSWLDEQENSDGLKRGDVKHWDALQEAIKRMGLKETWCKGVYAERHNPNMPAGDYSQQRHYVWNDSTQQMVELPKVYVINRDGRQAKDLDGYEEISAYKYGYKFTENDGIYERDGIKYRFDSKTKKFVRLETVSTNILFKETDTISANYLMQNLYKLIEDTPDRITFVLLSDNLSESLPKNKDPIISKFAQMLEDLSNQFNIYNNYDTEDLFKCVIKLMNKAAGIENSNPPVLTKQTIEKLNQKGFFNELDKILNSEELKNEYYFGADGYIDNFSQGSTGDCWLLAAIASLNSSEAGRQIIKNSISKDEEGNIVITFKGIGISYTITREEIEEARIIAGEKNEGYAHGDIDILALELATEKLRRDLAAKKYNIPYGNFSTEKNINYQNNGKLLYGGFQNDMLFYLTGNGPLINDTYVRTPEKMMEYLRTIYKGISDGTLAGYVGFGNSNVCATTVDGSTFKWDKNMLHAFAIVGMTEDTITIVNPWYPDKPYTFTWEVFANSVANDIGATPTELNEHNILKDKKTEYITINGQKYSLNDILESEEPILYKVKGDANTKLLIFDIINNLLSDIRPEISQNIMKILGEIYHYLCSEELALFGSMSFENGLTLYESSAEEYGVSITENEYFIDVKSLTQKIIEAAEAYLKQPTNLEEFEEKLHNGEFNKNVSEFELSIYLQNYKDLLIKDINSNSEYSNNYKIKLCSFVSFYQINKDTNEIFNLQEAINQFKRNFDIYKSSC